MRLPDLEAFGDMRPLGVCDLEALCPLVSRLVALFLSLKRPLKLLKYNNRYEVLLNVEFYRCPIEERFATKVDLIKN